RFGVLVFQILPFPLVLDDFTFVERAGFDNAWVADHFSWVPQQDLALLEGWTALAALAAGTERIRVGTMITNVATRNPAMLAKQALTVDQISGGRLDMGVGGGFFQREHEFLGIPFLDAKGRAQRLRESVEILDKALRGGRVSFTGEHYHLDDAPIQPAPTQQPRPPLWVAAQGPTSLKTAALFGDTVICMGEGDGLDACVESFRARMARVDQICGEIGRDPASLRRCYFGGFADEPLFASPEVTADFIARLIEASATDFVLPLANSAVPAYENSLRAHSMASRKQMERIADDVLPAFRS
ncbi:MAG TPA: LLM class flavin-dependent oxidoreductase, partial [Candidatus Dormibacteraeota bacterium]